MAESATKNTTKDLVTAIQEFWNQDEEEHVQKFSSLMKKAIEDEAATAFASLNSETDQQNAPSYDESFNQISSKATELVLYEQWTILPWRFPDFMGTAKFNDKIKVAELLHTAELSLKLIYVDTGTKVPQHAKNAREMVHILAGRQAKIGPIDEWLKECEDSKPFHEFLPTAPQVLLAGENNPLLYLSLWYKKDVAHTKFWFANDTKGQSYSKDIMAIENVQDYYNKMATDYEESMFGWGYCMPEAIADALVRHGGLKKDASILDLGCGNGLCGQALYNRGIEDINGIDFSSEMLKQCAKRACYNTLQKHDLLTPLPFKDNQFDCLLSVAVTTYLNPSVLKLWLKAAKKDALVSFTHKTSVWPEWESEQNKMEESALWTKVWVSDPIPYLPSLKEDDTEPCEEMAKVYIYRKL